MRCGKKVVRGERECWPCASTGLREFLEGKARNLGDDVINARLEASGGFATENQWSAWVYFPVAIDLWTFLRHRRQWLRSRLMSWIKE